ncbi:MAG: hypothetical protein R3F20_09690 [Planctomycetota bacterium]
MKVTHSRERRELGWGTSTSPRPSPTSGSSRRCPRVSGTLLAIEDLRSREGHPLPGLRRHRSGNSDETGLELRQLLTEEEYREAKGKYGDKFKATMGAEAVKDLLGKLDLNKISEELRHELAETHSKRRAKDIVKRLRTVRRCVTPRTAPSG